jgi:hypothetical protein
MFGNLFDEYTKNVEEFAEDSANDYTTQAPTPPPSRRLGNGRPAYMKHRDSKVVEARAIDRGEIAYVEMGVFPYTPKTGRDSLPAPVAVDYGSNGRVRVVDYALPKPPVCATNVDESGDAVAYCTGFTETDTDGEADTDSAGAPDCVIYAAMPEVVLSTEGEVGVMRRTFVAVFEDEPFAVFGCVAGVTVTMKFYTAANGKRCLMSIESALHRNDGSADRALTDVTALPALNVHLARYALPPFGPCDDMDMTSDPFWADAARAVRDADTDAAGFFGRITDAAVAKMWTYGMARLLATGTE